MKLLYSFHWYNNFSLTCKMLFTTLVMLLNQSYKNTIKVQLKNLTFLAYLKNNYLIFKSKFIHNCNNIMQCNNASIWKVTVNVNVKHELSNKMKCLYVVNYYIAFSRSDNILELFLTQLSWNSRDRHRHPHPEQLHTPGIDLGTPPLSRSLFCSPLTQVINKLGLYLVQ